MFKKVENQKSIRNFFKKYDLDNHFTRFNLRGNRRSSEFSSNLFRYIEGANSGWLQEVANRHLPEDCRCKK